MIAEREAMGDMSLSNCGHEIVEKILNETKQGGRSVWGLSICLPFLPSGPGANTQLSFL